MGRIKTALIKRVTNELVKRHRSELKGNFEENKILINGFAKTGSKKIRNTIAGYTTRIIREQREIE